MTEEDVALVQRCTLRYTQRRYFFARLSEPNWLRPLALAGFFRNPPDCSIQEDCGWSIPQWPEGGALARLAGGAPDVALHELEALPSDNKNPAVWDVVATAAVVLPPAAGNRLVPLLVKALMQGPPALYPRSIIDLIRRLADAGHRDSAFELTDALLFVGGAAKSGVSTQSSSEPE